MRYVLKECELKIENLSPFFVGLGVFDRVKQGMVNLKLFDCCFFQAMEGTTGLTLKNDKDFLVSLLHS